MGHAYSFVVPTIVIHDEKSELVLGDTLQRKVQILTINLCSPEPSFFFVNYSCYMFSCKDQVSYEAVSSKMLEIIFSKGLLN